MIPAPAIHNPAMLSDASSPTHVLARAVATAIVVTALALVAILFLAGRADWWRGFSAASVVNVAAAAVSVPVVAWGLRFGRARPEILTGTYFAAMFARAVISLGGASAAILLGGYPKSPTLLMVIPYYIAILAAETFVVARLLAAPAENKSAAHQSSAPAPQAEKPHA